MPPEKDSEIKLAQFSELLAELPEIKLDKKEISQRMRDTPLENQLLSLADVTIQEETELLRDIISLLKKTETE